MPMSEIVPAGYGRRFLGDEKCYDSYFFFRRRDSPTHNLSGVSARQSGLIVGYHLRLFGSLPGMARMLYRCLTVRTA